MDLSNIKILICDDSILFRRQIKECVLTFGCKQVFEANDGEAAVSLYNEYKPDLIFMDIIMPIKDGLQALIEILNINNEAKVIMISSVGTQNYIKSAIEAGAIDFLQKPIEPEKVRKIIKSAL